jgi:Zn-dependent M32 family carboxypeptidase
VPREWSGQPVGRDRGIALEESQSLLIEMIICRNRAFVAYLKPLLEKHLGVTGPEWEIGNLYRLLTRVRRSAIRVDADELTYPLHIMLRHDLEKQLLAGQLAVRDLPEAWNRGMEDRLEIRPATDAEGCLQDVHWAHGSFGYFPSYAIGAVIAAQVAACIFSILPMTRLTSGMDAKVSGSVCAAHPVTISVASGCSRRSRRISCRALRTASAVTAQVLTMTALSSPAAAARSFIASVS